MRARDLGGFYRVTCSESDVAAFAARWPCFGPVRPVAFEFHKESGDLTDVTGDSGMDGPGVVALSEDAQEYGAARLGLGTRADGPWHRAQGPGPCSVYRFRDAAAVALPGGPTVYVTAAAARVLAKALRAVAQDIDSKPFAESTVGIVETRADLSGGPRYAS